MCSKAKGLYYSSSVGVVNVIFGHSTFWLDTFLAMGAQNWHTPDILQHGFGTSLSQIPKWSQSFSNSTISDQHIYPIKMNPPKISKNPIILIFHLWSHFCDGLSNISPWAPWEVNSSTAKFDGTDCATPTQIIAGIETPWGGPGWGWDFSWILLIETLETRSKMIKVYLKLRFFLI